MFKIGESQIENEVAVEQFACNLTECKGACCTMPGGRGAPLLYEEVDELQKALPVVWTNLSDAHKSVIEKHGVTEGILGSYATVCVERCACVFVCYENGIAHCSIEKAWFEGKLKWRKPVSCHLFPIRIQDLGFDLIKYERIDECITGRRLGKVNNIYLHDFLKDPLIRKYGEEWYNSFAGTCKKLIKELKSE
ncbi:MAG: DUF3109 family protein [Ignavibacteriales bacterium]|nr:DUF3109 family protein [Ignavibacteriales bacterium]